MNLTTHVERPQLNMLRSFIFLGAALLVSATFCAPSFAQGNREGGPPRPGSSRQGQRGQGAGQRGQGQTPPILRIFDLDGDGAISKTEIKRAAESLAKLDSNGDGELKGDELRLASRGGNAGGQRGGQGGQRGGQGGMQGGGQGGMQGGPRGGQGGMQGGPRGGARGPGGGNANRGNPQQADASFAKQLMELDENGDQQLVIAEVPQHMHAAFQLADQDHNNRVDSTEIETMAAQFRRNRLNPDGENEPRVNQPTRGQRR